MQKLFVQNCIFDDLISLIFLFCYLSVLCAFSQRTLFATMRFNPFVCRARASGRREGRGNKGANEAKANASGRALNEPRDDCGVMFGELFPVTTAIASQNKFKSTSTRKMSGEAKYVINIQIKIARLDESCSRCRAGRWPQRRERSLKSQQKLK